METFTDDTVVALASFLPPHDMLSLALTCKRFGDKNGTDKKRSAAREESSREVRQRIDTVSLMEVAARTVLQTKWTDDEKKALPRREDESWIGLYQEFLSVFRLPLQFEKLAGKYIEHVEGSNKTKVCTKVGVATEDNTMYHHTAINQNVMRTGKHRISFHVNDPIPLQGILCGIMRPTTKDITSLEECHPAGDDLSGFSLWRGHQNVDCCLLSTYFGNGIIRRRWKEWEDSELLAMNNGQRGHAVRQTRCEASDWEGMERIRETSFKIGFVLNLDEGTLEVYKNDRRLGTLRSGLVGEYCWVVTMASFSKISVSIGRALGTHTT